MQSISTVVVNSPCCGKPIIFNIEQNTGGVASRKECPHCGEWVSMLFDTWIGVSPDSGGITARKNGGPPYHRFCDNLRFL